MIIQFASSRKFIRTSHLYLFILGKTRFFYVHTDIFTFLYLQLSDRVWFVSTNLCFPVHPFPLLLQTGNVAIFIVFVPDTHSVGNDPGLFWSRFLNDILFNFLNKTPKRLTKLCWPNFLSAHRCVHLWNPAFFWSHMVCIVIQYFSACLSPGSRLTWGLDSGASCLDFPEVFQGCAWQLANQTFWRLIAQDKNGFVEGSSFLTNSFALNFLFCSGRNTERKLCNFSFIVSFLPLQMFLL